MFRFQFRDDDDDTTDVCAVRAWMVASWSTCNAVSAAAAGRLCTAIACEEGEILLTLPRNKKPSRSPRACSQTARERDASWIKSDDQIVLNFTGVHVVSQDSRWREIPEFQECLENERTNEHVNAF